MKLKNLLLLLKALPLTTLLCSCGQSEFKLSGQESRLAERRLTEAPLDLIVWPDDRPSIADGKSIYEKMQCAGCHTGADAGSSGTSATKAVPDLGNKLWSAAVKPKDIYRFLTYGDPDKKHEAYRDRLSRSQIWDLTVYTKSLGSARLSDAEIAAIDPVFGSNCAVCHGTKGDGDGPLARNLEPMPANFQKFDRFFDRTDGVLYDHIANGIQWEGMPNFLGKVDRKKNVKFDDAYIHKLVQYVRKFTIANSPVSTVASAAGGSQPSAGANAASSPSERSKSKPEATP